MLSNVLLASSTARPAAILPSSLDTVIEIKQIVFKATAIRSDASPKRVHECLQHEGQDFRFIR